MKHTNFDQWGDNASFWVDVELVLVVQQLEPDQSVAKALVVGVVSQNMRNLSNKWYWLESALGLSV